MINGEKEKVYQKDALGDPENPISEEAVISKFTNLMKAADFNTIKIDSIINCVLGLSKMQDLSNLERVLR